MTLQETINKILGTTILDYLTGQGVMIVESNTTIILLYMSLKPETRGKGTGTKIMKLITSYADDNKKVVKLKAGGVPGTDHSKLIPWYESFGFTLDNPNIKLGELSIEDEVPMTYKS